MVSVPKNFDRMKEVYDAYEKGEPFTSIAQRMGVSRVRVHQLLDKYNDYISKKPFYDLVIEITGADLTLSTRVYNALYKYNDRPISLYDALSDGKRYSNYRNIGAKTSSAIIELSQHRDEDIYKTSMREIAL